MSVKNNQIEIPFSQADKDKLDTVQEGAAPPPDLASQAEAEAGTDNAKFMSPLRVLESILANGSGGGGTNTTILEDFLNSSGSTIPAYTLVMQDASSTIDTVDPSSESDVKHILGVLTNTTLSGSPGTVALSGLLKNITTSLLVGDLVYLSKTGTFISTTPEIGAASFIAGDFVVKIGKIIKNLDTPANKDLLMEIEILGQL